ncbi:hypothetical protein [Neorhizobium petrolearium]|jgi:hypothetical protein
MMLKIGMIGSGYIAGVHGQAIQVHPDVQLTAVSYKVPRYRSARTAS